VTKRRCKGWFAISLAIGLGAAAIDARSQTASSTCSTAPPAVQSFFIERAVMATDTETTYPTSLSASILASLAAGTMEIREQLVYNPQASTLSSTVFLVQAGAPIPTPTSFNLTPATLASYTISIDQTYTSCSPYPSLMFAGRVTSSSGGALSPNGIYNLTFGGTPATVSIGYTTDNPPLVNNVVTVFAGVAATYSAVGHGTLIFAASSPTGQPTIAGVVNSASNLPSISPNSWVTIVGTNLASKTDTWNKSIVNGALPTSLDGVTVSIGGAAAYVSYISPGQINAVAPQNSSGSVSVTVTNSLGTSQDYTVTSNQYSPAFFIWPGNQAVATHQDSTYAVKAGTFPGTNTTPAKPGETITLWGTGFGPTTPATPFGMAVPASQIYNTATLPSLTLNNVEVTVIGAAETPGAAALYQVAIQVPSSLADGDYSLQASIGGVTSPLGIILTVQN